MGPGTCIGPVFARKCASMERRFALGGEAETGCGNGRSGRIRTRDPRFWRPMLYQPELRSCKAGFGRIPRFLSSILAEKCEQISIAITIVLCPSLSCTTFRARIQGLSVIRDCHGVVRTPRQTRPSCIVGLQRVGWPGHSDQAATRPSPNRYPALPP